MTNLMTTPETAMLAWHFVSKDYKLRGGSTSILGAIETYDGPMVLCKSGLHWSIHALDALKYAPPPFPEYAPSTIIRRVRVWGDIQTAVDKGISRNREVLWHGDVRAVLHEFARKQALSVIHLWDAPEAVRKYLETSDESLRVTAMRAVRTWGSPTIRSGPSAKSVAAAHAEVASWNAFQDMAFAAVWEASMAKAWAMDMNAVWTAYRNAAAADTLVAAKSTLDEMLLAYIENNESHR